MNDSNMLLNMNKKLKHWGHTLGPGIQRAWCVRETRPSIDKRGCGRIGVMLYVCYVYTLEMYVCNLIVMFIVICHTMGTLIINQCNVLNVCLILLCVYCNGNDVMWWVNVLG